MKYKRKSARILENKVLHTMYFAGHKVHQVSDEAKAEVSEEAREAARQMAKSALEDCLHEIGMGDQEWAMYEKVSNPIQEDIVKLRGILEAMELKSSERSWLKRQSYGEIDDTKLIDGVTGDRHIYKRRGSMDDAPLLKKKRIRFVLDCSGSMYRFNGCKYNLWSNECGFAFSMRHLTAKDISKTQTTND